ncbi:HTTM domain-containing protein [Halopenitus salinus]|uniref:HTTM domain-containing protein n=1 Tax=Halopenitus salinus TaxID=1198295 RepID=A0ABD5V1H4_9EURY
MVRLPGRRLGPPLDRIRTAVRRRAGIDRRALAAFRIGLGTVILLDLLLRSRALSAHYTESGVLSREALASAYPPLARYSLHVHAESLAGTAGVTGLFVLAAIAAAALLVGYRTRIAALVSLALALSLQARNPFVLNSGDLLLWQLLLLSIFLPTGSRWSVDSLLERTRSGRGGEGPHELADVGGDRDEDGVVDRDRVAVASLATATLLVHVTLVYVSNAIFKLRGDHWIAGEGAAIAFSMDQFTILLGPRIAEVPPLLVAINYLWLGLLLASPLLVLSTGRLRTLLAAGIAGGHLGMTVTMAIAIFPLVSVVSLLVFLGPGVWDRVEGLLDRVGGFLDRVVGPAGSRLPIHRSKAGGNASKERIGGSTTDPRPSTGSRLLRAVPTALVACLLVGSLAWNAAALGYVDLGGGGIDPAEHGWEMFAPDPSGVDRWFVIEGTATDGERFDGFGRASVTTDPPPDVAATHPSARWRKYMIAIAVEDDPTVSGSTAAHFCDRIEDRTGRRVETVRITYVEQQVWPERSTETGTNELVTHECSG